MDLSSNSTSEQVIEAMEPELSTDEQLRQVDLCFVMDATGSMTSYIEATRRELSNLANKLSRHHLRPKMAYALTLYRDHPPQDSSFVTRFYPLSEHLQDIQSVLDTAQASGGGDGPEAVADGLYEAINKTVWRKGSHRIILLAGDAPPHGEGAPGDGFRKRCPCGHNVRTLAENARERGISIFSLGIGVDKTMERTFRQIASIAGGHFVPLDQASTLIDQFLNITMAEFGKVDIDRSVFNAYRPDITPHDIAFATGLSLKDVMVSMNRLRKKEMLY